MKIHYDIMNERKKAGKIFSEIKKNPSKNTFLGLFDKVAFIESLSDSMKKGEKIRIKIDEKTKDYPNILDNDTPRFVIQKDVETGIIPLSEYLKGVDGFGFIIEKKGNDCFMLISKNTDAKLDLKLRIDTDKTIDLNLLSGNKGKDKIFFGVKSYYYLKKEESF